MASDRKLYKEKAILAGTFFAGPLVGGYLLSDNFKSIERPRASFVTLVASILFSVGFFAVLVYYPTLGKVPNLLIPAINTWIAYFVIRLTQIHAINEFRRTSGQFHSWWRVVLVMAIGVLIWLAGAMTFEIVRASLPDGSMTKAYGSLKHDIKFRPDRVSDAEIDAIANALKETGYFGDRYQRFVDVNKEDEKYILLLWCDTSIKTSDDYFPYFERLNSELRTRLPGRKIVLKLVVDDTDDVVKVYE